MGRRWLAIGIFLLIFSGPVLADTIVFSNGLPNGVSGISGGAWDDFQLNSPSTLSAISFYGVQDAGTTTAGSISYDIYSGELGTLLAGGTAAVSSVVPVSCFGTVANLCASFYDWYVYTFPVNISLIAGTYSLQILTPPNVWWATADGTYTPGNGVYGLEDLAFTVYDPSPAPVPEPSTLLLLGGGLAAIVKLRGRKLLEKL